MPVPFSAARLIKPKAGPTTHVTTSEADWAELLQPLSKKKNKKKDKRKRKETAQDASARNPCPHIHTSSSSGSSKGSVARTHGLLTPHPSVGEGLPHYERVRRKLGTESMESTSESGETEFATPEGSFVLVDPTHARKRDMKSSEWDGVACVEIGVQTSPCTETPSLVSTPPASPSRSRSATPRPMAKRKRPSKPVYIRQGEKLSRELDDDLTYLAEEKRILRIKLRHVECKERELESLLIELPGAVDDGAETETGEETVDKKSSAEVSKRVRFYSREPLTPVSSEYEGSMKMVLRSAEKSVSRGMSPSPSSASYFGASSQFEREQSRSAYASENLSGLAPNLVHDPSTYLIWFDLETTDAIRPAAEIRILEVAVFVTDKNYRRLDNGQSYIVHWPLTAEEINNEMPQRVRDMHYKSGLLFAYDSTPPKERLSLAQVERRICKYLESHDIEPNRRGIMAGAGVAFDRSMVRQHMEKLDAYFGHQIFDTTTLWHFIRRKYNRSKRFSETCAHRALDDIIGSCNEAKLYSELVLRPSGEVNWPTRSSHGV